MSFCVQRSRRAQLAWGHVLTNHIRLVPWQDNNIVKDFIDAKACGLRKLPTALIKKDIVLSIGDLKIENKRLYVKNRMYLPENKVLQLHLLQQHHNPLIHEHPGYKTMY